MDKKKSNCIISIYSRDTGYFQPLVQWNPGKTKEFHDRKEYNLKGAENGKQREDKPDNK